MNKSKYLLRTWGDFKGFVIREESAEGLSGLVNLIGIESPGLTASPAIAEYVCGLIEGLFASDKIST